VQSPGGIEHDGMGGASGMAGGSCPYALCPAPAAPSRREKTELYVPSGPFPSIVAA